MAAPNLAPDDLTSAVAPWPDRARALVVADQASYEGAAVLLREIKTLRGAIEQTFGPITAKAHAAWKESLAQRKRHEAPLELAEGTIKRAMGAYAAEQDRLRREEQARIEREHREAEAKRRAAEREAEEAARLAEATQLEAAGMTAEADAVLEAPMPEPDPMPLAPPPPSVERPKAAGVSVREVWQARVVDLRALVAAVAAGKAPLSLVCADESALRKFAAATKGSVQVDGVSFYADQVVSSRAS